jgi:thioredoxin-dependent peroxiredoxin
MPTITAKNAIVLGISPDPQSVQKKWREKKDLPFDLLTDADHQVMEAWGAWGEKLIYGKKAVGVIRSHWVIDENGVVIEEKIGISPRQSVENAVRALG